VLNLLFKRIGLSFIYFFLLFSCQQAVANVYQNYDVYEDSQGNIYLQLPKQFVLIHSDVSIPLHVLPTNGLLRLIDDNGTWQIDVITEAQFNALTLSPSDYAVEYIDFSGDGDTEVILRADSVTDDSFILYGIENGTVSFSVHRKYDDDGHGDGIDLSQTSNAVFTDVNGDGYKDIRYSDYTLLGNEQDKFFNTSRYEIAQSTLVGSTGGNFRVAEDGSATYQIPLKLPQGTAGVTPQVAFNYSSSGGHSTMGRGWSLSGITSISRCPKNYAQDGHIQGVQLSITDEYCYNGQRLKLASGTHGTANATYHTELADFSVITITSANTQGATGFKVETKSGETHYYGASTVHTTANAYVGSSSAPSAYLIAAIRDVKNNQISYTYNQESGVDEVNLDKIEWGGSSSNPNKLQVTYADNPRPLYGYRNGRQFSQTKLIDNVELYQSGTVVRRYNLDWNHGLVTLNDDDEDATNDVDVFVAENISRIDAIQECLIDGTDSHCLAPTKFRWSSMQTGTHTVITHCGMGNCPVGEAEVVSNFVPFSSSIELAGEDVGELKGATHSLAADANGDGISDIYFVHGGDWHVSLMSASGSGNTRAIAIEQTIGSTHNGEVFYAQAIEW